jgi:hypothetical protein
MNAGIGTALLPTIQIGLGFLQALKAFSLERSLGVADAGFNFSFGKSRALQTVADMTQNFLPSRTPSIH